MHYLLPLLLIHTVFYPPEVEEPRIHFELTATDPPCNGSNFTLTCTSTRPLTICSRSAFDWFKDNARLSPFLEDGYMVDASCGINCERLTFKLDAFHTNVVISCGLIECGSCPPSMCGRHANYITVPLSKSFFCQMHDSYGKYVVLKVHCHGYTICLYMIDCRLKPSKIAVRALRNSLVEG